MKLLASPRFLSVYSGVLTLVFCGTVLLGASAARKNTTFDEISVRRINVLEPDGTLRLVIASKAYFPGTYIKGKEHPRDDRQTAGVIFLNDEGSEIGGLVYGGSRDAQGKIESHGHLSFDQYMATQVFTIDAWEENNERSSRLKILDWRERPGENGKTRLVLGRTLDRAVGLKVMDPEGRDRILLQVKPDGTPELAFLDAAGKVTRRWPE